MAEREPDVAVVAVCRAGAVVSPSLPDVVTDVWLGEASLSVGGAIGTPHLSWSHEMSRFSLGSLPPGFNPASVTSILKLGCRLLVLKILKPPSAVGRKRYALMFGYCFVTRS